MIDFDIIGDLEAFSFRRIREQHRLKVGPYWNDSGYRRLVIEGWLAVMWSVTCILLLAWHCEEAFRGER